MEGWNIIYRTELEVQRLQTLYAVNVWAKIPMQDPKKLWKYSWEGQTKGRSEKEINEQVKKGKALAKKWQKTK